jgi:prolyl-tRNA editing enzyme YbaK/EbsC (Cys-tRNA(Pro) deacylase)
MADVTKALDEAGVEYELLSNLHTERAVDEAEALGLPPTAVAKTLVLSAPEATFARRARLGADRPRQGARLR